MSAGEKFTARAFLLAGVGCGQAIQWSVDRLGVGWFGAVEFAALVALVVVLTVRDLNREAA